MFSQLYNLYLPILTMGHTQTLYSNWSWEAVSKIVRPFLRSRYPCKAQTSPGLTQKSLYTELIELPF